MRYLVYILLLVSLGAQAQPYKVKKGHPSYVPSSGGIITPAAPTNFVVNDVLNTASITLSPGYGTTDHEVSINSGASYNTLTSLPVTGLTGSYPIGTVRFRVAAGTGRNASAYISNPTAYTVDLTQLSTPTLTATVASNTQIDLSWTNIANESSYKLEWSANGTTGWTQIGGTIAANTTTYSHTGLTAATTYYYRVSAIGDGVTYSTSGFGTDNETTTGGGISLSTYPTLADTGPSGDTPPGDSYSFNAAATPAANTPTIAEWTRQASFGETIALTGDKLKVSTNDAAFYVYRNGIAVQTATISTTQQTDRAAVLLPSGLLAWDFYVMWPENANGKGSPIKINGTETFWMQRTVMSGETGVSIYGRNLAHGNVAGTNNSYVRIQSTGGGTIYNATVTNVTPYRVQFTVPSLSNGTYNVYVHNGHGGVKNYSSPLVMTVQTSTVKGRTWGTAFVPSTNTFTAINTAAVSAGASGNVVDLAATTYTGSIQLDLNNNTKWVGEVDGSGNPTTIIRLSGNISANSTGLFDNAAVTGVMFENIKFETNGFSTGNTGYDGFNTFIEFITLSGASNVWIKNCWIDGRYTAALEVNNSSNIHITGGKIYGGGTQWSKALYSEYGSQIFIDDVDFYFTKDAEAGIGGKGLKEWNVTNCTFQDLDNTTTDGSGWGKGRIWAVTGNGGAQYHTYFAGNTGTGLGVRKSGTSQPDANSGEIFLWEAASVTKASLATSATSTTITFSSAVNNYVANGGNRDLLVTIAEGKGLWQTRKITGGLLTNTITVSPAFNVTPDNTSYCLVTNGSMQGVLYNNTLNANGKSYIAGGAFNDGNASSGFEAYGGCYGYTVDGLYVDGIREIAVNQSLQASQNGPVSTNSFILIQNVTANATRFGIWTRAFPEPAGGAYSGQLQQTGVAASVYRNVVITNQLSNIGSWYIPSAAQANGKNVADLIIHEKFTSTPAMSSGNLLNWARWEFGQTPAAKASGLVGNEVHTNNAVP